MSKSRPIDDAVFIDGNYVYFPLQFKAVVLEEFAKVPVLYIVGFSRIHSNHCFVEVGEFSRHTIEVAQQLSALLLIPYEGVINK